MAPGEKGLGFVPLWLVLEGLFGPLPRRHPIALRFGKFGPAQGQVGRLRLKRGGDVELSCGLCKLLEIDERVGIIRVPGILARKCTLSSGGSKTNLSHSYQAPFQKS